MDDLIALILIVIVCAEVAVISTGLFIVVPRTVSKGIKEAQETIKREKEGLKAEAGKLLRSAVAEATRPEVIAPVIAAAVKEVSRPEVIEAALAPVVDEFEAVLRNTIAATLTPENVTALVNMAATAAAPHLKRITAGAVQGAVGKVGMGDVIPMLISYGLQQAMPALGAGSPAPPPSPLGSSGVPWGT